MSFSTAAAGVSNMVPTWLRGRSGGLKGSKAAGGWRAGRQQGPVPPPQIHTLESHSLRICKWEPFCGSFSGMPGEGYEPGSTGLRLILRWGFALHFQKVKLDLPLCFLLNRFTPGRPVTLRKTARAKSKGGLWSWPSRRFPSAAS